MKLDNNDAHEVISGTNRIELRCDDETKARIDIIINGENNRIVIGELVEVEDKLTILVNDNDNLISIGKGCTFEETSISVADNNNHVILGEDCMFARNTRIMASDFHAIIDLETGKRKNIINGVIIDNHVWVGYGAIILKKTHIYSNSIVSAGAIVRGNVSANSIYAFNNKEVRKSGRRFFKRPKEVTWERQRKKTSLPVKMHYVRKSKQFDALEMNDDIVVNIENDISTCFNRIKGWAIWKAKDSSVSELYIRCLSRKDAKEKNLVVPLANLVRTDVAEYFGDEKYEFSGFDSYMPADVINNWQYIERVELIIRNTSACGKKIIYDKIKSAENEEE